VGGPDLGQSTWQILPRAAVAERILTLPLYAHMRDEQVELVTRSVLEALSAEPEPAEGRERPPAAS
jgi:hypothetical protein